MQVVFDKKDRGTSPERRGIAAKIPRSIATLPELAGYDVPPRDSGLSLIYYNRIRQACQAFPAWYGILPCASRWLCLAALLGSGLNPMRHQGPLSTHLDHC